MPGRLIALLVTRAPAMMMTTSSEKPVKACSKGTMPAAIPASRASAARRSKRCLSHVMRPTITAKIARAEAWASMRPVIQHQPFPMTSEGTGRRRIADRTEARLPFRWPAPETGKTVLFLMLPCPVGMRSAAQGRRLLSEHVEQVEQDDDRDRKADEPEQNSAHVKLLMEAVVDFPSPVSMTGQHARRPIVP